MSKTKETINLSEKQFDLFKSLLIAIVSGFSVVLFQQMFFKSNVDYELRKDILKDNYEYYVAIQNFADLNNYTEYNFEKVQNIGTPRILIDVNTNDTIQRDTIYEYSKTNKKIIIPTISVDSLRQKKWIAEKNYIETNKNKIDQDIYLDFQEIVSIVENNSWPQEISFESLNKNIWSEKKFENTWSEKNMKLHYKASQYIKIK
ncbi:hypothetical protein ACFSKN_16735 [Mariniflexile gromovii]|uniref:Uncharacterized protein n=1 Tax=Mariniflexile gromovii TaxID=362523 RepID=A0ABS4BZN9_9FLAO|nr:hypothetical protein [Mariniflexile gromovii]MBP0905620.1 hypothetical protein [Mariniflexile gromovii]